MKLDHVAIIVKNIEHTSRWYTENLNAEIEYKDETWAMLKIGESKIALTIKDQHPPHIAVRIPSLESFPPGEIKKHRDGSFYLYTSDPDGNIIEYIHYPRGNHANKSSN